MFSIRFSVFSVQCWVFTFRPHCIPHAVALEIFNVKTRNQKTLFTLSHVRKILAAAGCSLNDVVKSTVHLADINEFDRYNAVYKDFFKNVPVLPARTTVQSVLWNGIKVEIDVVARKSA